MWSSDVKYKRFKTGISDSKIAYRRERTGTTLKIKFQKMKNDYSEVQNKHFSTDSKQKEKEIPAKRDDSTENVNRKSWVN